MRRIITRTGSVAAAGVLCVTGALVAGPTGAGGATGSPPSTASTVGSAAGATEAPVRAAARATHYVALGDSAAAGPVIVPQQTRQPAVCTRSQRNFPTLVARSLDADTRRDVTCSGATISDFFTPQRDAPPQLRAVTGRATHVSVGPIGANDAGIVQAVVDCLIPTCRERQGRSVHRAIEATRPDLRRALAAVERRAPRARIVVVGYGQYLVRNGCRPTQPITPSDANYVQGLVDHMDRVLKSEARRAKLRFVDLRRTPRAMRHTSCAPAGERWLEGLVPASGDGAASFHPTALGMTAFSGQVVRGIRAARAR